MNIYKKYLIEAPSRRYSESCRGRRTLYKCDYAQQQPRQGAPEALWNANARPRKGKQARVYTANKSRHVFLNSAKNAPLLYSLFLIFLTRPSSVCGSVAADKSQPGGATDVALTSIWASWPCAASHGRCRMKDTPHSRPPHSEGPPWAKKEGFPPRCPPPATQPHTSSSSPSVAAFIHVLLRCTFP